MQTIAWETSWRFCNLEVHLGATYWRWQGMHTWKLVYTWSIMGWFVTVKNLKNLIFFFLFWIRVLCNSGWSQTYDVAEDNIELHILLPPAGECFNYIHIWFTSKKRSQMPSVVTNLMVKPCPRPNISYMWPYLELGSSQKYEIKMGQDDILLCLGWTLSCLMS